MTVVSHHTKKTTAQVRMHVPWLSIAQVTTINILGLHPQPSS